MRKTIKSFMMVIAIIGSAFATKAQNLVPNPSFENAICPTGYNGFATQVALYMNDWYSATCASPDIMTTCSNHPNTTIPNVLFGHQYARTGNNFAGFGFYAGWYEYLGVRLTQPLVAGEVYDVSFFASCANGVDKATDALGIYFSDTTIKCISGFSGPVLNYTPQIVQTPGVFLNDTLGWQEVSGHFTAQGGEEYIVVGYFKPWNVADLQSINNMSGTRCYYYVDDFSVKKAVPPAQPGTINGLQNVCKNSLQTFSVAAVAGATSYTWSLPNGWTGTSTTNSITATIGNNSGNISVTANNYAGSSIAQTLSVTVSVPDVNVSISNTQLVAVSGQQSYQWLNCGNNLSEIAGEIQHTFSPNTSGSYAVSIEQDGCIDTSFCVAITLQNVSIAESSFGVSVYPNPVKNNVYVTVENSTSPIITFSITDLSGKVIHNGQSSLNQNTSYIYIPERVSSGIYLIEISNGSNKLFKKIVVEK